MMVSFTPLWQTPIGSLGTIVENQTVGMQLLTEEMAVLQASSGDFLVVVGPTYLEITTLLVNGIQTNFSYFDADQSIRFAPLSVDSQIILFRNSQCLFSLISGTFPAGLVLSSSGQITGTLAFNNSTGVQQFTIRAANESLCRDRVFSFLVSNLQHRVGFSTTMLAQTHLDQLINQQVLQMGTYERTQYFVYSLDLAIPLNSDPYTIEIQNLSLLTNTSTVFNGPPTGLYVSNNQIVGFISYENEPGDYYFQILLSDGGQISLLTAVVRVLGGISGELADDITFVWATDPDLGSLYVSDQSFLQLVVTSNKTVTISYTLTGGGLPPGLTLESSGLISGIVQSSGSGNFIFRVRAQYNYAFIDQTFTLAINKQVNDYSQIANVYLQLSQTDQTSFETPYRNLITSDQLFRPDDWGFSDGKIYILRGIQTPDINPLIDFVESSDPNAIANASYFYGFDLASATHNYATLTNSKGIPVCEVIYRTLVGKQEQAGGFDFSTEEVQPVVQRGDVYPISVRNMRLAFVNRFGFQIGNQTLYDISYELLPPWMNGFTIALPIAYVKIGQSVSLLKSIAALNLSSQNYWFDQLSVNINQTQNIIFLKED